jgi:hypothetical protein
MWMAHALPFSRLIFLPPAILQIKLSFKIASVSIDTEAFKPRGQQMRKINRTYIEPDLVHFTLQTDLAAGYSLPKLKIKTVVPRK